MATASSEKILVSTMEELSVLFFNAFLKFGKSEYSNHPAVSIEGMLIRSLRIYNQLLTDFFNQPLTTSFAEIHERLTNLAIATTTPVRTIFHANSFYIQTINKLIESIKKKTSTAKDIYQILNNSFQQDSLPISSLYECLQRNDIIIPMICNGCSPNIDEGKLAVVLARFPTLFPKIYQFITNITTDDRLMSNGELVINCNLRELIKINTSIIPFEDKIFHFVGSYERTYNPVLIHTLLHFLGGKRRLLGVSTTLLWWPLPELKHLQLILPDSWLETKIYSNLKFSSCLTSLFLQTNNNEIISLSNFFKTIKTLRTLNIHYGSTISPEEFEVLSQALIESDIEEFDFKTSFCSQAWDKSIMRILAENTHLTKLRLPNIKVLSSSPNDGETHPGTISLTLVNALGTNSTLTELSLEKLDEPKENNSVYFKKNILASMLINTTLKKLSLENNGEELNSLADDLTKMLAINTTLTCLNLMYNKLSPDTQHHIVYTLINFNSSLYSLSSSLSPPITGPISDGLVVNANAALLRNQRNNRLKGLTLFEIIFDTTINEEKPSFSSSSCYKSFN